MIERLTAFVSGAMARLEKIWEPLWKVLSFSLADERVIPKSSLCILLEKDGITVARGSRFLSALRMRGIKHYPFEEGGYPPPEAVASAAALAFSELKAGRAEITLSIPKAWTIIETADLPLAVKENLPDVVAYEMDRLTPFSSEEAFYDFRVLKEDDDKISIMIAAAKADVLHPYLAALRDRDLPVNRMTFDLAAMGAICRYLDKGPSTIFMGIDAKGYEGAVIWEGSPVSAFSGDFRKADESAKMTALMEAVNPLLEAMKKEGRAPHLVVDLRDRGFEMLPERVNAPVKIIRNADLKPLFPDSSNGISCNAAGSVLESLRPRAERMDLLGKGRHKAARYPAAPAALLMFLLFTLGILYLIAPLQREQYRIQEIDRQIMQRKEEVKKVEALKKELEGLYSEIITINQFKKGRPMALDILKELTTVLPKTAWLARTRVTDTTVDIEGYASGSAAELLPQLEASKYFQKVEFASPTMRDARLNADRFVIKMEIEGIKTTRGEKVKSEKKE